MKLRPRRRTVLLKLLTKPVDQKIGRIYIPQVQWSMNDDNVQADVISVGKDCRELKEGMRVIVGRFAVVRIDDDHVLVREEDIIAEVKK